MHLKVKSGFFLTLSTIVLSACGGLSSSLPSSSSLPPASSSPSSEAEVCPPRLNPAPSAPLAARAPRARSVSPVVANGALQDVTLTFDSKGGSVVASVTQDIAVSFAAPLSPTKAGFTFGGWFNGKPGLTWLEPQAVAFPLTLAASTTLYAYWEPINSKTVNYSGAETYVSTLSTSTGATLNPLTYLYNHENQIMGDLSTPLYSTEVDWDKAIEQGVADYVGDFSRIVGTAAELAVDKYLIDALDFSNILIGAKSFPKDVSGDDFTVGGKYDREIASKTTRTEWIFEMREDIFFETGRPVDASVVDYSLRQYLDPAQNNRRATGYYARPTERNDSGTPILNAEKYRFQTAAAPVAWDTVGFKIIDTFTFSITLWRPISQAAAVGFGNITLLEPTVYAASLTNGVNSTYGTPANPFRSYGAYIIKSYNENQRLVLNKNFAYIRRDLVTYKSIVYEFTSSPAESVSLFEAGRLSAVGLVGEDFIRYSENPNIQFAWSGFPQYMIVNFAPSRNTGAGAYVKSSITLDARFRQALFFAVDREAYNSTIYVPNVSSVMPVPTNIRAYIEDPIFYSESPQHLENLTEFGIAGTNGYIPTRAKTLFEAALADFKLANPSFSGPINLRLVILDSPLNLQLATFMKSQIENTFNTSGQTDKIVVNIVASPVATNNANTANWDFDLALTNLGFGGSTGVHWQYGSIGFIASLLFGPTFGLHLPTTTAFSGSRSMSLTNNSVQESFTISGGSDLLTAGDTFCVLPGDLVYGTNIPSGAKVSSVVNATTIQLSASIPASVAEPVITQLTIGEPSRVTGSTAGLAANMDVYGSGIRPGTKIVSIVDANTMVLSTSVTANGPVTVDIRGSGNLLSDPASFFNKPLNIDLSVTLDHLEQMDEDGDLYELDEDGEELLPGHIELYQALLADPDTGKERGIYTGSLFDLAYLMYVLDTPYDGTREEPFAGATGEVWNIVQAMERVFFQEMPMIPTSTLQSATLYASNVVILWPEYSVTFGWGAGRYRYLNSDLDFSNGFYNSYEVAFRASQQA